MSKTTKKLMIFALLLYAGCYMSCYIDAHQHQPVPGEVWASDLGSTGWFNFEFVLLIVAGGLTFAAMRFGYYKAD